MDNKSMVRAYLGELADRALRFQLHLDAVAREFYSASSGLGEEAAPEDKPLFLESFRHSVQTVLETTARLADACHKENGPLEDEKRTRFMNVARHAFLCINTLHENGLMHLPRPSEPVELRRFCRIIARYVLRRQRADLAVYVTESIPEGAYAADPITHLKTGTFAGLVELANDTLGETTINPPQMEGESGIHVTIARIDSRNPIRWASLLHEAGHKLLTAKITGGEPLEERFYNWLPAEARTIIDTLEISVPAWLTETWCDLFAALVLGPSVCFSQFAAFIASPPTDGELKPNYPPHSFRLRLLMMFVPHHYKPPILAMLSKSMDECIDLVEYWDHFYGTSIDSNDALFTMFNSVRAFFQDLFFAGSGSDSENFQRTFEEMVRYTRDIEVSTLKKMQSELSAGLPVASKAQSEKNPLVEEPTSVQEVLLAGWLDKIERLREEILTTLQSFSVEDPDSQGLSNCLLSIERFDDAILRSLQLGEWLHYLSPKVNKSIPEAAEDISQLRRSGNVLNDREIVAVLQSGDLRVIPLVDLEQQLGSTSLDIRLGTSFEVFLPACRRSPDSTILESFDSRRIDLDLLEHVVLLPGQFMLAHSFEYLKLPNWIASDLDGRSSYARLGLEVHMTAGMIDPGFEGVVTYELFNSGPNPIRLFPGLRVGQLRFTVVNEPARPYSRRHKAKYSGLLQHNRSLYMNDPDFIKIELAIKDQLAFSRSVVTTQTESTASTEK